ncbi:MAG: hypothetical protein HZA54_13550 [Planctomycetes bacterium]|nr:hypothetical protein [Planctomycetota bacterium]
MSTLTSEVTLHAGVHALTAAIGALSALPAWTARRVEQAIRERIEEIWGNPRSKASAREELSWGILDTLHRQAGRVVARPWWWRSITLDGVSDVEVGLGTVRPEITVSHLTQRRLGDRSSLSFSWSLSWVPAGGARVNLNARLAHAPNARVEARLNAAEAAGTALVVLDRVGGSTATVWVRSAQAYVAGQATLDLELSEVKLDVSELLRAEIGRALATHLVDQALHFVL